MCRGSSSGSASWPSELDLADLLDRPAGKLSAGQKTRVALAKALINRPELLLLDEPTASLDPDTGDWVRTWLERYRADSGCTILLASHNMAEVDRLCSQVLMLKQGRIVDQGTPDELLDRYGREDLEEVFLDIARDRRQAVAGMNAAARRIWGLMYRHLALYRRSWPRLLELAYWPVLQMCIWGFTASFLAIAHGQRRRRARRRRRCWAACCCGRLRLRSQMGVSITFMEEMWSRNLGHVFVSPLRPWELVAALIGMSVIRMAAGRAAGDPRWPGRSTRSTCSRWGRSWCCSSST